MKYKLAIIFVLLGSLSLWFSTRMFNESIIVNVDVFSSAHGEHHFVDIKVDSLQDSEQKKTVFDTFVSLLDEYQLNSYLGVGKRGLVVEYILFYHSSDETFANKIWLENGEVVDFGKKVTYLTNAEQSDRKIYTILPDFVLSLAPFDINNPDFHLTGHYEVTANYVTQDINDSLELMCSSLNGLYDIDVCQFSSEPGSDNQYHDVFQDNSMMIFLPVVVFFALLANSSILDKTDEISKKKLEGNSNAELFYEYFFRYVIIYTLVLFLAYWCLYVLFVPIPVEHLGVLLTSLGRYTVVFLLLIILVGFFFLYEIVNIPINLSMKGKNHAKPVKALLQSLKTILIVGGLPLFLMSSIEMINFSVNLSNAKINRAKYHNLYEVIGMKPIYVYEYFDKEYSEEMKNVYMELLSENGGFCYWTEYLHTENELFVSKAYHRVGGRFLEAVGLSYTNPQKTTAYIYRGEEISKEVDEMILSTYGDYDVVRYDKQVYNYEMGLIDYFSVAPYADKEIVLYVDNSLIDPPYAVYGIIFYYEGSLEDAQKYFDMLMQANNLSPSITLLSAEIEYETSFNYAMVAIVKPVAYMLFYILSMLLVNKQIIEMDELQNKKWYYLEHIEGNRIGSFAYNYILVNILIWAFAQCVFFLLSNNLYLKLPIIILIFFSIELLSAYFYHRRIVARIKGGM